MRIASQAVNFMVTQLEAAKVPGGKGVNTKEASSLCVIGIRHAKAQAQPLADLVADTDFVHRVPKTQWYTRLLPLIRLLEENRRVDDRHASECTEVSIA